MMKRKVIPLAVFFILVAAFLVAPVAAGLTITDGDTIFTRTGNTSPVINITGPEIPEDGTITIDVSALNGDVWNGTFMNANVVVADTAVNAIWTGVVDSDILTLTSNGGNTTAGEKVTVTFTGAAGSAWIPDTGGGVLNATLTANRTDTSETATFNIVIETTYGPGGLTIAPGEKITATDGATSMVITVTDAQILQYDSITIYMADLDPYVANGTLGDANVGVTDTAAAANWTGAVQAGILTLTSNGGATAVDENVTVTLTGAGGNTWIPNTAVTLTAFRMDNYGSADFNFVIEIVPPPGGLTVADGAKITTALGVTSPVITITDAYIALDGTITINVTDLHAFVAGGTLSDANVVVNDTAAAANWTGAVAGNTLTLTSTDNATVIGENVTLTFTGAAGAPWIPNTHGNQTVHLTATRTDGLGWNTINFMIETAPPPGFTVAANFSASPTSDIVPVTITFTDTSLGNPTSWNWSFGDGTWFNTTVAADRNPAHTYTDIGTYMVSLNATNAYGSDTKTQWNYIHALNGAIREANTSIDGLTITNCGGPQTITVDTSVLSAALIPNNSVLEIQPLPDRGFKNITIYALNGVGFSQNGDLITGNPSGVHLVTEDIAPSPGFSNDIGTNASFNISIDLLSYPCNAKLSTKIWEGVIPDYDEKLHKITSGNVPPAVPIGTAYTAKITKTNFPSGAPAKVHISVNSSWNGLLSGGPGDVFIWRIADDGNSGQILPTTYLYNNTADNLDYYEADSPLGMSTFGLSSLTGNNNPFQIIAFIAINIISPPSNPGPASMGSTGGGGGGSGAGQTTVASGATSPDQSNTAKLYSNDEGTITQATTLQSTDGLAKISLDLGIVARDSNGRPLESLSIRRIPAEELPAAPALATFSFAGMAYEIGPDGTTFSPAIPLSFTIPQEQAGQDFVIHQYDHATGTWLDLPSSYDPQTGTITVQVSHLCCFALFAKSTGTEQAVTPEPTILISSKSSMQTNVEMYGWLFAMIVKNPIIIVIVLAVLALVAYFGWWKRRL